jgi:hypothetical protein
MSTFIIGGAGPQPDLRAVATRLRRLAEDLEAIHRDGRPPRGTLRDVPVISGWSLATHAVACLSGVVTGHPDIGEGRPAITSQLWALDRRRGYARTLNRFYRLGSRR